VFGREGILVLRLATHAAGYVNLRRHMDPIYYGATFWSGKRSVDVTPTDKRIEYPLEMLFGRQSIEDITYENATAATLAKSRERITAANEDDDRNCRAYLIASIGSLTVSGLAASFKMRSSPA